MSRASSTVEDIINAAIGRYNQLAENDRELANLLTIDSEIQRCNSDTRAIRQVFQKRAQTLHNGAELMKCLDPIVEDLHTLSATSALSGVTFAPQPIQLVFSALNILLVSVATKKDATNRNANCEALLDLVNFAKEVLQRAKRLENYLQDSTATNMTEGLVKIMMELMLVFAIAANKVTQPGDQRAERSLGNYVTTLQGQINTDRILKRLDRLSQEEAAGAVKPTLEVIYGLVNSLTLVMEGKAAPMKDIIAPALCEIKQVVVKMARVDRYASREKIRAWLSPPDPSENHNSAFKAHYEGTSSWFTEREDFKNWDKTGGLFWIHGKPGSGKTVLCSTIVDLVMRMRDTGLASVGYFYVDGQDSTKQEPRGLLSSLLTQLCAQSDHLCDTLISLHKTYDRGAEQPPDDALVQCLRKMLEDSEQGPVFIIVDALDEFPNKQGIRTPLGHALDILKMLVEINLPHLHFCFTSQLEIDIKDVLDPLGPYCVVLHEEEGQLDDISMFVKYTLSSDATMREWPQRIKDSVIDALSIQCDGMFKWTSSQLEILRRCPLQKIPGALKELPRTLDDTYERILQRIAEEPWQFARRIFQFLTVAVRPLRVQELGEVFAIDIEFDEEKTGIPKFYPVYRPKNVERDILSACSTMITVVQSGGDKIVKFSHLSVKDYLTSSRLQDSPHLSRYHLLPQPAHTLLAKACLSILFQLDGRIHKDNVNDMLPLVSYAAEHWVYHAQNGVISSLMEDGMDRLFDKDKTHFAAWLWVYDIDNRPGPHMVSIRPEMSETAPLYYAALCGFLDMVKRLVGLDLEDVGTQGRNGGTPLHAALRNDYSDVALLLLRHKADATAGDNRKETPLHIAARRRNITVIRSLIDHGAKVNAKNEDKDTPLSLASRNGDEEAAKLLLEHRADVDHQIRSQRTALHVAAEHGHDGIAKLLLDNKANVNARDMDRRTPLHLAVTEGKNKVAELLLQRGAQVDAQDRSQLTPLHTASSRGQEGAAQVLLNEGAVVDTVDEVGRTALHLAASSGHLKIVDLLLKHKATLNKEDKDGKTPSQLASDGGHAAIAKMLEPET